jgi:hypothetical protein
LKKVLVLLATLVACSHLPTAKRVDLSVPPRQQPTVTWGKANQDTFCDESKFTVTVKYFYNNAVQEVQPVRQRYFITGFKPDSTTLQIYRLEWCPAGDSCFNPISYKMVHRVAPFRDNKGYVWYFEIDGLIAATDSTPGDQLMLWRSHPWPGTTPEDNGVCMIPVR